MFMLLVKTVTKFLFHFLGKSLPASLQKKKRRSLNKHYQPAISDDPWVCWGGDSEEQGDEGIYFLPFVLYTVKKRESIMGAFYFVLIWVCVFLVAFNFFFIVNTRYFSDQRKKCHNERTEQMWLATGWASCCSHLQAATTLTHSRASILRLAAARPWQGWGRGGGVGDRSESKQPCFPPLCPLWPL